MKSCWQLALPAMQCKSWEKEMLHMLLDPEANGSWLLGAASNHASERGAQELWDPRHSPSFFFLLFLTSPL